MTSSDTPTAHDLARALADQIHPNCPPRDVIVSFRVRPQAAAAAEFGHRSRGGPVTSFAQSLHARLYGLPTDPDPLPTALDALLQATHIANSAEQQTAILRQLADQLRNATEIIYRYAAQWERRPTNIGEQLRQAHDQAQQVVEALDRVAPAFSNRPEDNTSPRPAPPPSRNRASAPVTALTTPAGRHR
ncbi:hypothetical protein ABZ746_28685 [Streptomyces sp. NPDC020096]